MIRTASTRLAHDGEGHRRGRLLLQADLDGALARLNIPSCPRLQMSSHSGGRMCHQRADALDFPSIGIATARNVSMRYTYSEGSARAQAMAMCGGSGCPGQRPPGTGLFLWAMLHTEIRPVLQSIAPFPAAPFSAYCSRSSAERIRPYATFPTCGSLRSYSTSISRRYMRS